MHIHQQQLRTVGDVVDALESVDLLGCCIDISEPFIVVRVTGARSNSNSTPLSKLFNRIGHPEWHLLELITTPLGCMKRSNVLAPSENTKKRRSHKPRRPNSV